VSRQSALVELLAMRQHIGATTRRSSRRYCAPRLISAEAWSFWPPDAVIGDAVMKGRSAAIPPPSSMREVAEEPEADIAIDIG